MAAQRQVLEAIALLVAQLDEQQLGTLVRWLEERLSPEQFRALWRAMYPMLQGHIPAPTVAPEPGEDPATPGGAVAPGASQGTPWDGMAVHPAGPEPGEDAQQPAQEAAGGANGGWCLYWMEGGAPTLHGHDGACVAARHGRAPAGGSLLRAYDPNGTSEVPATVFASYAREARESGAIGYVCDLEIDWMLHKGPAFCQEVARVVRGEGLPFGWAPKAPLDHFDAYKGRRTWGWEFGAVVEWFARTADFLVPWQYSWDGPTWDRVLRQYRQWGFAGTIIPLTEPQRTWDGNRPIGGDGVAHLVERDWPVGFFAPPAHGGVTLDYSQSTGMRVARAMLPGPARVR